MSDEEVLKKIRERWLQEKNPINRDIELATIAIKMHPSLLEIIPAKAFPHSKWKASQQYLLDTSAANTMRLTGLLMIIAVGLSVWTVISSPYSWYINFIGIAFLMFSTLKAQHAMSRAAILKGALESSFVFTKLWELQAFAIRVNKDTYEPTGNENKWQDIVFLALGLNDLISKKPLTRQEILDDILGSIKKSTSS